MCVPSQIERGPARNAPSRNHKRNMRTYTHVSYLIVLRLRQRCGDIEHLPHSRGEGGRRLFVRPRFGVSIETFSSGVCSSDQLRHKVSIVGAGWGFARAMRVQKVHGGVMLDARGGCASVCQLRVWSGKCCEESRRSFGARRNTDVGCRE